MNRLLLAFGLLFATGCAAQNVARGSVPNLGTAQGLVVLVVDTNVPLNSLIFTRPADLESVTLGAAEQGLSAHVLRLPVGRYELTSFRIPHAAFDQASEGRRLCFEVNAGEIAYPGHLVLRYSGEGQGEFGGANWGWRANNADVQARLSTGWAGLTDRYDVKPTNCQ